MGGTGGVRCAAPVADPGRVSNSPRILLAQSAMFPAFFTGAGGGGGGGRPSVPSGGNGGNGGGAVIILADTISITGTGLVSANGQDGVYVGGGGSGGFIYLGYRTALTNAGIVRANGGSVASTTFGGVNTTLNGPAVDGTGSGGGSSGVIRAVKY